MSIIARKSPRLGNYTGRTKQMAIADCYRSVRAAMRDARYWATALRCCHYKRGTKKQYALLTSFLLDSLSRATWWRNQAHWVRRNHP